MTAVEWLAEELTLPEYGDNPQWVLQVIQKAKEMEKQEQKSNWMGGYLTCAMKDHNLPYGKEYLNLLANKEIEAEQYYNETFKSE
jgi:uncharacterized protein YacL (UPF0231 family)